MAPTCFRRMLNFSEELSRSSYPLYYNVPPCTVVAAAPQACPRVRVRVCIVWRNSFMSCVGPFIKDGSKRVIWRIIPICPRLHAAQIPSPAILLPINSINYPLLGILCTVAQIIWVLTCVWFYPCFKCSSAPYLAEF